MLDKFSGPKLSPTFISWLFIQKAWPGQNTYTERLPMVKLVVHLARSLILIFLINFQWKWICCISILNNLFYITTLLSLWLSDRQTKRKTDQQTDRPKDQLFLTNWFGKWSWGRISWDQNSTFSWDQNYDHEIEIMIMRSKLDLIMRSKLGLIIWQIWSWGRHFNHEVEIP